MAQKICEHYNDLKSLDYTKCMLTKFEEHNMPKSDFC